MSNGSTVVSIIRQRRRYLLPTCCQQLSYRSVQKPNRAADWVCTPSSYSEGPGFHSQSKGLLILGCYSVHKSFVKTRQRGFLPDTCQFHVNTHHVTWARTLTASSQKSLPVTEPGSSSSRIISQMNPLHTATSCLSTSIIFPSTPRSIRLSLTLTHLYTELCPIDYVFRRQDSE